MPREKNIPGRGSSEGKSPQVLESLLLGEQQRASGVRSE